MGDVDRGPIVTACLSVLALVALGVVLKSAQAVIRPLIIAWLLSYILGPAIESMSRWRIPAPIAVCVVLFLLLGACWLSGIFMYARISAFASEFPKYRERLTVIVGDLTNRFHLPPSAFADVDWATKAQDFVVSVSGSFVTFLSNLVTVVIFLVFFLLGRPYTKYKIKKALSPQQADRVIHVLESASGQIGNYLSIQFLISLVTGVLVWLVLACIGVDFALTWGTLAFLLNFIPTVGSIVASIPPVLLAVIQFYPSYWPAVICCLCLLTIQMAMGNVISPKVMGDRLDLSPVVILLSLLFWGWLWGMVGALLSTPIACTIKIVCENVGPLRPISVMMTSGKAYQREYD
ncbi:MAG: AI-2E family transporter [Planctomycetes bacterium]|nr:AI-2E family transporter [Planctomycetota bacterium]